MVTETNIELMFSGHTMNLYLSNGSTFEHNVTQMLSKLSAAASHIIYCSLPPTKLSINSSQWYRQQTTTNHNKPRLNAINNIQSIDLNVAYNSEQNGRQRSRQLLIELARRSSYQNSISTRARNTSLSHYVPSTICRSCHNSNHTNDNVMSLTKPSPAYNKPDISHIRHPHHTSWQYRPVWFHGESETYSLVYRSAINKLFRSQFKHHFETSGTYNTLFKVMLCQRRI